MVPKVNNFPLTNKFTERYHRTVLWYGRRKTMCYDTLQWQHTVNSGPNVQHTTVSVLNIVPAPQWLQTTDKTPTIQCYSVCYTRMRYTQCHDFGDKPTNRTFISTVLQRHTCEVHRPAHRHPTPFSWSQQQQSPRGTTPAQDTNHIASPPPYIITHSLYIMCIGPMMRSQHPPHTNNTL